MKKLTILVDMDDTVEHLLPAWVDRLNAEHSLDKKIEDMTEWDMTKNFPELEEELIFAPLMERGFWKNVKPIPGAPLYIGMLIQDGHDVYIVTASQPATVEMKLTEVLFKYFPTIDYKHVIVASNKQMIRGDVIIDDAPFNLVGAVGYKILMDTPVNQSFECNQENGIVRVSSWQQIYELISDICCKEV